MKIPMACMVALGSSTVCYAATDAPTDLEQRLANCPSNLDSRGSPHPTAEDVVDGNRLRAGIRWSPIVRVNPIYPRKALRRKEEGEVTFLLTITGEGKVANAEVVSNIPDKKYFKSAATKMVLKNKYYPIKVDGVGIGVKDVCFKMVFDLESDRYTRR